MNDTPVMKQYRNFKEQYSDMILFFRLGDFYEMFDSDAVEVSSLLNLTLTHKGDSPMCGIPYHASNNYIKRLLDAGKKIAICDQLGTADSSKSLIKREVVRIITPATVIEEGFYEQNSNNYIVCFFQFGCAYCDITTGDFFLRRIDSKNRIEKIRESIQQLNPKEIIVCEDEYFNDTEFRQTVDFPSCMITKLPSWYFSLKKCNEILCSHAKVHSLKIFDLSDTDKVLCPAGALLQYIIKTAKDPLNQITSYKLDDQQKYVSIDESSRKNLELFKNLYDNSESFTLFQTINRCRSCSGQRMLKQWISFPLYDIDKILFRQQWVKYFAKSPSELSSIRKIISKTSDVIRLTTRVLMKKCNPSDLVGIKKSIESFFEIVSSEPEKYKSLFETNVNAQTLESLNLLMIEIEKSINPTFLGLFNSGEVILSGYDSKLDELRNMKEQSDKVLNSYLEQEKESNGLTILKLGYNRVFGYFLEVPNSQIAKVPSYFIRRQTLSNAERFTTEKLQEYEKEIMSALSLAQEREKELYDNICNQAAENAQILNSVGKFIAQLDVFQSLATVAVELDYVCPKIVEADVLLIKDGRHPVVEKQIGKTNFVVNSLDMSTRFSLITGPNMAGKSTYLRQNALIILLAHIGSFVPASYAEIGLIDKLFCRVGASDNLARGESTFLLEMEETAYILRNCTQRSFVIVDEIGRGTSTQDGMSIAYAVMKDLINKNVKTLFATHYHELTFMDNTGIHLQTLQVAENKGDIVFLRKVIDGVANSSYGIHVAKLAGIPYSVVREAVSFQNKHFADYSMQQSSLFTSSEKVDDYPESDSFSNSQEVMQIIKEFDLENCTPVQAMVILSRLKEICS